MVAGRIAEKHRCLLTDLPGKADVWRDDERHARLSESFCQRMKGLPVKHYTKVRHGDGFAVHRIVTCHQGAAASDAMGRDLVSPEVKVNPVVAFTSHPTAQQLDVKAPGRRQVCDRKSQMKGIQCRLHGVPSPGSAGVPPAEWSCNVIAGWKSALPGTANHLSDSCCSVIILRAGRPRSQGSGCHRLGILTKRRRSQQHQRHPQGIGKNR